MTNKPNRYILKYISMVFLITWKVAWLINRSRFLSPCRLGCLPHAACCNILLRLAEPSDMFQDVFWYFGLQRVLLNFERFDVGEEGDCRKDNITVTDSVTGKQLGTFCGQNPPGDVISSRNRLLVVFSTDSSETRSGFVIKYTARKLPRGRHTRIA